MNRKLFSSIICVCIIFFTIEAHATTSTSTHVYETVTFENIIEKYPVCDVRGYSTLALAVSAMGTDPATILIPEPLTIAANLTIPSNITLRHLQGGIITVPVGVALTHNGYPEAGMYQIYNVLGTVTQDTAKLPCGSEPAIWRNPAGTGGGCTGGGGTPSGGLTTQILVGGGASLPAVWTTATGSGAPARAIDPTFSNDITVMRSVITGTGAAYVSSGTSAGGDLSGTYPSPNVATIKSSATTGRISFTGPAASTTRVKTVRDANDTILELGGSYTPTGAWDWVSGSPTVTWPTFNQNTTGTANLAGGNATTLLGSIPYQSGTNTTTMRTPNVTTTKKFLVQTGDGTNGAAPVWDTIDAGDVSPVLAAVAVSGSYNDLSDKPSVTPTGELLATQVFDDPTDVLYTATADTTYAKIRMAGAGGSAGSCDGTGGCCVTSGAGAGEYCELNISVTGGVGYVIAIGAKGAQTATGDHDGSAGGNTTITIGATTYTCGGGGAGKYLVAGSGAGFILGGNGGASTTGTMSLRVSGTPGHSGLRVTSAVALPGIGGGNQLGSGGNVRNAGYDGFNGSGYGGGGAGLYNTGICSSDTYSSGTCLGGAGANGVIIVEEYK